MGYVASIVIPLRRQVDQYLDQCVRSALAQTVPTEVIVVRSDVTPPSNLALLERLQREHAQLSVVPRRKSGNFPNALNVGIECAQTARVGFLLSDDWLSTEAVAECLGETADIVSTSMTFYFPDGRINHAASRMRTMAQFLSRPTLEEKAIDVGYFMLFQRELAARIGLDETLGNYPGIDDYDFVWTLLEHGATVAFVEKRLYHYRDHDGERLTLADPEQAIRNLEKILKKHGIVGEEAEKLIKRYARWFGRPVYQVMGLG